MNDTVWYIRTYRCDNGIEYKTKFPVRMTEKVRASYSRMRTAQRRAEKSATEAAHELGRVLNCNFRCGRDVHMVLGYSDAGLEKLVCRAGTEERDAVYHAAEANVMDRFMRRLRRACAKAGVELRFAVVTSDMDGETGEEARIHHHLVINAEAAELAAAKWTDGGARGAKLYGRHRGDLQELADYLVGQVRYFRNAKRYTCSRNLKKAVCGKPVKARSPEAELIVPRGCEKIWRGEYRRGGPQHVRYWRPPEVQEDFDDE